MRRLISEVKHNEIVELSGWIYREKRMKSFSFVILQDRSGYIQLVVPNELLTEKLMVTSSIKIKGMAQAGKNNYGEIEVVVIEITVLNAVHESTPIHINESEMTCSMESKMNHRTLSLHHMKEKEIFKIQALLAQGFVNFMSSNGFTQIFSPKLVEEGAEGGTEVFRLPYFEKEAYLAQSPQFYKQMMVGSSLERVFEIGHVYRAEKHSSRRHLNEYVSLDVEMGFIESEEDIMKLEEELLKYMLQYLSNVGRKSIRTLGLELPKIENEIPRMPLNEAIQILRENFGMHHLEDDLDPEAERLISKYIFEQTGSEFVFLTNYPKRKRPMYTMTLGASGTRSFDLLFRGLEITTGGQRIHEYDMLCHSFKEKGLNPENYRSYLEIFKYGMPPHGGFAIGLERLTAQLLHLENIRQATLFPRDRQRLTP